MKTVEEYRQFARACRGMAARLDDPQDRKALELQALAWEKVANEREAMQVTDFARGLTMRARIGTPRKTLLKDAEEAADLVLLPRCASDGLSKAIH